MGLVYLHLHEWLIFMVNVSKYTSPMDPMGLILIVGSFKVQYPFILTISEVTVVFSVCLIKNWDAKPFVSQSPTYLFDFMDK